jgi:hypothetical protein
MLNGHFGMLIVVNLIFVALAWVMTGILLVLDTRPPVTLSAIRCVILSLPQELRWRPCVVKSFI